MIGETDLAKLLKNMRPELHAGEYVFCVVNSLSHAVELKPLSFFQEKEGLTVILPKKQADENALSYSIVCAWITLNVHSALEAVGLTAAISKALTEANISCNVVAAYYHDHIFIPIRDAKRTMDVLLALTKG